MDQAPPHIAILPSPGMGHLIPLTELAKFLVSRYGFTITFITADTSSKVKAFIDSLPSSVTSIPLPSPPLDDLAPDVKIETRMSITTLRSLPALRAIVSDLKKTSRLVAFVFDLFGTDTIDVANEFGVPPYIFFPSTATGLILFQKLPELDEKIECEYRDLPEPIRLPGCTPLWGKDLLDPVQDRKNDAYKWVLHHTKRYKEAHGVLLNSFDAIEPGAIKALTESGIFKTVIYPVGPLTKSGPSEPDESGCLKWLDGQPHASVLFVSFGSGGTLSLEQLTELAAGLEMSRQRFLWVVRIPSNKDAGAAFFSSQSKEDPLAFLPEGFVERTKGVGLLVPSWAPQVAVLSHEATGGFLTHCGWNSTLESVVHGVPMIAWPLYAEQKMNAVTLVEDVKVAIRAGDGSGGVVGREEIARVVKALMEGEEGKAVRSKVEELQEEAKKTLDVDGSSYLALAEVANKWKNTSTSNE